MVSGFGRIMLVLAGSLILLPLVVSSPNGTFLLWPTSGSAISTDVAVILFGGLAVMLIHAGLRNHKLSPRR